MFHDTERITNPSSATNNKPDTEITPTIFTFPEKKTRNGIMSALAECIKQGYYYYEIQYFYLLIYFIFDSGNDRARERGRESDSQRKWACITHYKRVFKHEIQTTTITTASTLCTILNIDVTDGNKWIWTKQEKKGNSKI